MFRDGTAWVDAASLDFGMADDSAAPMPMYHAGVERVRITDDGREVALKAATPWWLSVMVREATELLRALEDAALDLVDKR